MHQSVSGSGTLNPAIRSPFTVMIIFQCKAFTSFTWPWRCLQQVDQGKLSVDQKVFIRAEEFIPNTVSPIADKYPNGNVELTDRRTVVLYRFKQ